jgi:hypothetical protein
MKHLILLCLIGCGTVLAQSNLPACRESGLGHNCWGAVTDASGRKYVGEFQNYSRKGLGIEYSQNGVVLRSGLWLGNDSLSAQYPIDTSRFPFDNPTSIDSSSQDKLPPCKGHFIQSEWSNCEGKFDWGTYVYTGEFLKNLPHGRGEKRKLDGTLIVSGVWESGKIKLSDPLIDPKRCELETTSKENCWTTIDFANGQRFVGFMLDGKPQGEGILYFSDGVIAQAGIWDSGNLTKHIEFSKSKFPFDDSPSGNSLEAERERERAEIQRKNAEFERNRPPEQRIAFCVQTVQSSGSRYPSTSIPYCQDACNKTYGNRMCSEVGGSKWRVQTASPKTSPPNSEHFSGFGNCACIGQEYVLNEIKEMPAISPPPLTQSDSREAELVKREKALAEREKALLEAENKRLRDELEAERKKKK